MVEYHGPHSPPALELFACSRLKHGNSVHGRAETIPFLNFLPLGLVKRVVHVGGRQDHSQHFRASRVLRTPYSLEVSELRVLGDKYPASNSKESDDRSTCIVHAIVEIRVTRFKPKSAKTSLVHLVNCKLTNPWSGTVADPVDSGLLSFSHDPTVEWLKKVRPHL